MGTFAIIRHAFGLSAAAALLAGCGVLPLSLSKGQDDMQPPGAVLQTSRTEPGSARGNPTTGSPYEMPYRFRGGSKGGYPAAGLINVRGTLYGTTYYGGRAQCEVYDAHGCGTVFALTP